MLHLRSSTRKLKLTVNWRMVGQREVIRFNGHAARWRRFFRPLFPRRLQFPMPVGLNLLQFDSECKIEAAKDRSSSRRPSRGFQTVWILVLKALVLGQWAAGSWLWWSLIALFLAANWHFQAGCQPGHCEMPGTLHSEVCRARGQSVIP